MGNHQKQGKNKIFIDNGLEKPDVSRKKRDDGALTEVKGLCCCHKDILSVSSDKANILG